MESQPFLGVLSQRRDRLATNHRDHFAVAGTDLAEIRSSV